MNRPRLSTRPATRRRRSWLPSLEEVEGRQLFSAAPLYVLGTNGNLWEEAPGWQTSGRTEIDSTVKAFVPAGGGDLYVEGTNGALWLEGPNWQTSGRTLIDSNVEAFAAVGASSTPFGTAGAGQLYVEGTNGNLWLEGPNWQTSGRVEIDGNVEAFTPDPCESGYLYVEGTNGNLWLEAPNWQSAGRTEVDSNVQSFASDPYATGYLYVEGTNGALWLEAPNWQSAGRTEVDSNVQSFASDPYATGYLYVEGTNGNLWLEAPGWQTAGRTEVDANVESFASDPYATGYLYVEGTNGALWLEAPGWQTAGRTEVDANVEAFAGMPQPNPATSYSSTAVGASLFNNSQPSYLDVEQGSLDDCWLLASLAEVADRDPQDIKNMFTYDGTTEDNGATAGLYTVRYFTSSGTAIYVQVDTDLPSGGTQYDHVANGLGTQALWVALAEKAYAEANGLGCVTTEHSNQASYDALNFGDPEWALQAITGKSATDYSINPTNIATAWNAGDLVVLTTNTPSSSYIVGDHCYAVVGYSASSTQPFQVFNPWGTTSSGWAPNTSNTIYGLFTANAAFISQNFVGQSIGTGAINVNDVAESVDGLTESATLGDGYATSGTIKLTRLRSSGLAVDTETATSYTRPAQGTAIGTDPGDPSDGNHSTVRDVKTTAGPMVIGATGAPFTRTGSFNRTFGNGV